MNENSCCIKDILEVINILQNNAERIDDIDNTCNRPFLGNITNNCVIFNTRPVSFYNCNNTLITMPYTTVVDGTTVDATSSVFRVERVEGNAITLRVLAPNPDTTSEFLYVATNSFFTITTNCICALRCLNDTFISCI